MYVSPYIYSIVLAVELKTFDAVEMQLMATRVLLFVAFMYRRKKDAALSKSFGVAISE